MHACVYSITHLMGLFCVVVMSEDMVDDGYENIMNVDISSVAIDLMRRKYEHMPQLNCILLEEFM